MFVFRAVSHYVWIYLKHPEKNVFISIFGDLQVLSSCSNFCLLVKLRLFSLSLAYSPHICLPLLIFIFCPAVVLCLYRLALYVYEYLLHVGAQKSAQTFLSEVSHENALCVCAGLQAMYFMCPL